MVRELSLMTWVCVVTAMAAPRAADAQGTNTAQAEQLFRDGKRLMGERKFAEACVAFEASQKLEANIVTKLRIADCREQNGELATAWGLFLQVESDTRRDAALAAYHQTARERSAAIEPRLSYLIINVADASRTGGLTISHDGVVIEDALWNRALPVDGGEHVIEAKARGREPWTAKVTVKPEGDKQSVDVPRFDDVVPAPAVPAGARPDEPAETIAYRRGPRWPGLAVGAAGLVAGGAAIAFELSSRAEYDDSKAEPDDARQLALYESADRKHKLAQGFAIGGTALVIGGAVLWWKLGKPSPVTIAPTGDGATVGVGGRF